MFLRPGSRVTELIHRNSLIQLKSNGSTSLATEGSSGIFTFAASSFYKEVQLFQNQVVEFQVDGERSLTPTMSWDNCETD